MEDAIGMLILGMIAFFFFACALCIIVVSLVYLMTFILGIAAIAACIYMGMSAAKGNAPKYEQAWQIERSYYNELNGAPESFHPAIHRYYEYKREQVYQPTPPPPPLINIDLSSVGKTAKYFHSKLGDGY